jgi:hypothetical protein
MKIIIASKDRTAELAPGLKTGADARMADTCHEPLPWSLNALSLAEAKTETEFLERWADLSRRKSNMDLRLNTPRPPGFAGRMIWFARGFLWRLLRYQHERVAFRQNLINSQTAATLEFQYDEIRRLRARLDELEKRGGTS